MARTDYRLTETGRERLFIALGVEDSHSLLRDERWLGPPRFIGMAVATAIVWNDAGDLEVR